MATTRSSWTIGAYLGERVQISLAIMAVGQD
jgi:hypothetical protein